MDEASARTLLEDCLRVLWYRDCRALNKIQIVKSSQEYFFLKLRNDKVKKLK